MAPVMTDDVMTTVVNAQSLLPGDLIDKRRYEMVPEREALTIVLGRSRDEKYVNLVNLHLMSMLPGGTVKFHMMRVDLRARFDLVSR